MLLIAPELLMSCFARYGNRFRNAEGLELMWTEVGGVSTSLCFYANEKGPFHAEPTEMHICTSEESQEEFIKAFQIQKLEDIDRLGYTHSWKRYLIGQAEIEVTPMELEATLAFRIYKSRTLVSSLDLHFYDEVYRHLTLPEDFLKYVSEHERALQAVCENRYRVGGG